MSHLQTQPIAFDTLHAIVGNGHRAQKHAKMTASGAKKYFHVKRYKDDSDKEGEHLSISDDEIYGHLLGTATYAVPLIGTDGNASAGVIEQDTGGLEMARRILQAAQARGVVMFAIVVKGSGGHDGCHAWAPYDGRYDPAAIRAQLRTIAEDAGAETDEIHPNNTNIRLPFGLHLRSNTRGRTLLQTGELFENDNANELEAAERAVMALSLNSAPPELPKVEPKPAAKTQNRTIATTSRTNTRQAANDAIAEKIREVTERTIEKFKNENTLERLLDTDGAKETRDGYTCPYCTHTHDTMLYISKHGRLFSYSNRCLLHTTKGWDALGYYVKTRHHDNFRAAIDALSREYGFWFDARAARAAQKTDRQTDAPLIEPQTRVQTAEQRADAERKRAERRAATAETISQVQARASQDDRLGDRDQLVLLALLEAAGDRDWCRYSVARLAEMTEMCERYVHESLRNLEHWQYISSGRRNGGTTFRTFLHLQDYVKFADGYKLESDLDPTLELVSAPRAAQPAEWELWEACNDEASGYDLALELSQIETIEAENTAPARDLSVGWCKIQPDFDDSDQPEIAVYDPGSIGLSDWRDPTVMRPREAPHDDAKIQNETLASDPEPEVLSPPTDRLAAAKYHALRGKARKATSDKQRFALNRQADALMVWRPARDVAAARRQRDAVEKSDSGLLDTPPVLPAPHKLAPEGRPLTLAMDLSQVPATAPPDAWACIANLHKLKQQRDQRQAGAA